MLYVILGWILCGICAVGFVRGANKELFATFYYHRWEDRHITDPRSYKLELFLYGLKFVLGAMGIISALIASWISYPNKIRFSLRK